MIMAETPQKTIILIVEDESVQLDLLADQFADEGFRVLRAQNGKEGLALAFSEHPDIILLDLMMPVMNGITMMREIREANEWGKKVPIILLTNLSPDDEERMQAVTRDEPAYYLVKANWSLDQIVEKVKERLSRI